MCTAAAAAVAAVLSCAVGCVAQSSFYLTNCGDFSGCGTVCGGGDPGNIAAPSEGACHVTAGPLQAWLWLALRVRSASQARSALRASAVPAACATMAAVGASRLLRGGGGAVSAADVPRAAPARCIFSYPYCCDGPPPCSTSCFTQICIQVNSLKAPATIQSACPKYHPDNVAACCKNGGDYWCVARVGEHTGVVRLCGLCGGAARAWTSRRLTSRTRRIGRLVCACFYARVWRRAARLRCPLARV